MSEESKNVVAFFNAAGAAHEAFTATVNGGADKIQYTAYCNEAVKDLYMKHHKDDVVVWAGLKSDFKFAGRRVTLNEEDAWQVNDALCPPPRLG